jgi:hypothetical protein
VGDFELPAGDYSVDPQVLQNRQETEPASNMSQPVRETLLVHATN